MLFKDSSCIPKSIKRIEICRVADDKGMNGDKVVEELKRHVLANLGEIIMIITPYTAYSEIYNF